MRRALGLPAACNLYKSVSARAHRILSRPEPHRARTSPWSTPQCVVAMRTREVPPSSPCCARSARRTQNSCGHLQIQSLALKRSARTRWRRTTRRARTERSLRRCRRRIRRTVRRARSMGTSRGDVRTVGAERSATCANSERRAMLDEWTERYGGRVRVRRDAGRRRRRS